MHHRQKDDGTTCIAHKPGSRFYLPVSNRQQHRHFFCSRTHIPHLTSSMSLGDCMHGAQSIAKVTSTTTPRRATARDCAETQVKTLQPVGKDFVEGSTLAAKTPNTKQIFSISLPTVERPAFQRQHPRWQQAQATTPLSPANSTTQVPEAAILRNPTFDVTVGRCMQRPRRCAKKAGA